MRALIIGVDGQDGHYLKEFLKGKGYEVFGVARKKSAKPLEARIDNVDYYQIFADLTDYASLTNAVLQSKPEEIYNLAGQSEIPLSWQQPGLTAEVNAMGILRLLEIIRFTNPGIRFFQASSSEMYGASKEKYFNETSQFAPKNPYGISKLFAHECVKAYREKYGFFACSGIMFNHESPRRGPEFVTRKITMAVAAIALNLQDCLEIGNLNAVRDWGFAGDYVRAMWLLLQQENPSDCVIATGISHTVRDFIQEAFACAEMPIYWEGKGLDEVARLKKNGRTVVRVNPKIVRYPLEDAIYADPTYLHEKLGFCHEVKFDELVGMMIANDLKILQNIEKQR